MAAAKKKRRKRPLSPAEKPIPVLPPMPEQPPPDEQFYRDRNLKPRSIRRK